MQPPQRARPRLSNAALAATQTAIATDEYNAQRALGIANERPLTLYLDGQEIVTLMTLGCHPEWLALGYIRNQGLVESLSELTAVQTDWSVSAVAVSSCHNRENWQAHLGSRIVTTGCGQGTVFGDLMEHLRGTTIEPCTLRQSTFYALLKNLNTCNTVYKQAGSVHGCALCRDEQVELFVEDVGRHNAVDAIAGKMWWDTIEGRGRLFYTTGRLTSEMVIKVIQMGVPILASRSGITAMGLQLAQAHGVMLIARAAGRHFLVYNGAERMVFDVVLPTKYEVAHRVQVGP